jgi:hydrogenase nickel insertion protein HypA
MHEISLVQNLIEQLRQLAADNGTAKVLTVTMEIGPLSGVVIDSFQFGFDTLTAGDKLLGGARLVIRTPDAVCRCSDCGHVMVTNGIRPEQCPLCGDRLLIPEGGDDIILRQVEME